MDTVLNVDEINEEFYISFNLKTQWYDSRLKFNNLKKQEDLNVLTPAQHSSIWTPNLIFYNTKSKKKSSLKDATIRVLLNNNFTFEKADMTVSNNVYLFKGSENKLEISQVYDIYFICQYNMRRYPFDTQECHVDIVLTAVHDNFCRLNVQNFSYTGDLDLRQYFIREYSNHSKQVTCKSITCSGTRPCSSGTSGVSRVSGWMCSLAGDWWMSSWPCSCPPSSSTSWATPPSTSRDSSLRPSSLSTWQ